MDSRNNDLHFIIIRGDTQGGSIYLEGFGWIPDEGGGSVQHNIDSDGDINKQVGNMG